MQLPSVAGCHRLSLLAAKLACSYLPMSQLWHLFHLSYRALSYICSGNDQTFFLPIWVRTPRGVLSLLTFVLTCLISPRGTWGCSHGVSEIHASGWWARQRDNLPTPHLCPGIRKAALPTWWWLWLYRRFSAGSACVRISQPFSTQHTGPYPALFLLVFGSCHWTVLVVVLVPLLAEPCDQTDQRCK